MKILVTGGSGYKGAVLIPKLIENGHHVISVDNNWFGDNLDNSISLEKINCDIRDIDMIPMAGIDSIIHLANIANDPSVDLNPTLSWEVNVLATYQLADKALRNGVKQIIYASSEVFTELKKKKKLQRIFLFVPISVYNKTKMVAERVLLSFSNDIDIKCNRPATVCGLSPRMRLDVSVNMLTFQALENKKITVFGGNQTRPNIHIQDMVNVYSHFIENTEIPSGCYNAGFENISILDIAKKIQKKLNVEIIITESNDPRSYRQDSSKLLKTGFSPKYSVDNAIDQVIEAFHSGELSESENVTL